MAKKDIQRLVDSAVAALTHIAQDGNAKTPLVITTRDGTFFAMDASIRTCIKDAASGKFKTSSKAKSSYICLEFNYANYPNGATARTDALCAQNELRLIVESLKKGSVEGVLCHMPGVEDTLAYVPVDGFGTPRINLTGKGKIQGRGGMMAVSALTS